MNWKRIAKAGGVVILVVGAVVGALGLRRWLGREAELPDSSGGGEETEGLRGPE
jgi:hypothetical protein